MKTILHVIDTTGPGGAETVFIELADRLRTLGYRSIVVIRGPGWVYDELRRRDITPHIIPAKGSFNIKFVRALIKLIRAERVDVIQSHLLGSNVYCALVGLITRRPVVATFHGRVDVNPNERLRAVKLFLMNLGVKYFVTVSKSLCAEIHAEGLLNRKKTQVIYNGIDTSRYGKSSERALLIQLGLGADTVLVGSLGNVRPAKAYDVLIKAVPQIIACYPQAHFVIAGDIKASLMTELDLLLKEFAVSDHVHFLGFCNDSAAFLAQLDIFLLSSRSEGFSISTIEAMATGLPIVATRCGGPEEIVSDSVDGLLVESENPIALANGVLKLLDDRNLQTRIAENGNRRAREAFEISGMIGQYTRLYES
ncbi:MAG: hypothetical protein JWM78_3171 [Verrucomicrobiaceae bacterium]|nr:hypothetical protein [Verrucomicrobiaceae bacterium]